MAESFLPPKLSEQQLTLLGAIYAGFRQQGKWPTVYRVDKVLDNEGLNMEEIAGTMPSGLTNLSSRPFSGNDEATLTVVGLIYVPEAIDDAGVFMQILSHSIKAEQVYEPPTDGSPTEGPLITSDELKAQLGLSVDQLKRIYHIVRWEPWCGSGGWGADGFNFHVTREIRRYRGVNDLREYADRKLRAIRDAYGQVVRPIIPNPFVPHSPPTIPEMVRTYPAQGPGSEDVIGPMNAEPKRVFVIMPFQSIRNAVYREIQEVCGALGVSCLRADEIEKTGRITEQIYEAIANADALVADIGGLNPNVMYELGYAHALKKEVTLLNDSDEAPFDLKDFRWILYDIDDLQFVTSKLPHFLRNSLRLD